jgi:hypothetical protein
VSAAPERPQAIALGTNITAAMSDGQILLSLGVDPARSSTRVTQGKDGYSTEYSAGGDRITITRSLVSGVSVMRGTQSWYLGKP